MIILQYGSKRSIRDVQSTSIVNASDDSDWYVVLVRIRQRLLLLESAENAQCLCITFKATILKHLLVKLMFAVMPERWVSNIVS